MVAERFGVDREQVRRDHLLSDVLAAIAVGVSADDVTFFGGTALSRTFLADARLSEDIDLVAIAPRAQLASVIQLSSPTTSAAETGRRLTTGGRRDR